MFCKSASYENFRNIKSQSVAFENSVNIIYGDNAEGKTNALEGIFLCAQGRSGRSSKEKDFIKFGESYATVSISYEDKNRSDNSLALRYLENGKKQCMKNGIGLSKMSEFIGNFTAILFTPEHLGIVKSGPGERRRFIDCAMSQIDSLYVSDLQNYAKLLYQRNKLLCDGLYGNAGMSETIEIWSLSLAELCERISLAREKYIKELSDYASVFFSDMSRGQDILSLSYSGAKSKEEYFKLLSENLERELKYKTTLFGIHRDDIEIKINDSKARIFASQGQQRSASLSMKLAEGELSKVRRGEYPVFLFDDILSELDRHRKEYIMKGIDKCQVIITSCEGIDCQMTKNANKIYCHGGMYETR